MSLVMRFYPLCLQWRLFYVIFILIYCMCVKAYSFVCYTNKVCFVLIGFGMFPTFTQWHCALGELFCPVHVKHVCETTHVSIIKWGQFGREITVLPILRGFVFVAGFLAATKQLYEWYFLSVRLSVCPSHLFDYVPIIVSSWNFTSDQGNVHAKGQGQRSKVKVTEVATQLSRYRTVTPVWIHIWWWNDTYSLMLLRRGALLFFKVIRQVSRSHGAKIRRIWPRLGVSGLQLQFDFTNGYEMLHKAWSSIEEVPYSFSRSSLKLQGRTALKIVAFDPDWAFLDCNSNLNSPMGTKWCTKLDVG